MVKNTKITAEIEVLSLFLYLGVTHADDLLYLFSTGLFPERTPEEEAVSKEFTLLWTSFASGV